MFLLVKLLTPEKDFLYSTPTEKLTLDRLLIAYILLGFFTLYHLPIR